MFFQVLINYLVGVRVTAHLFNANGLMTSLVSTFRSYGQTSTLDSIDRKGRT